MTPTSAPPKDIVIKSASAGLQIVCSQCHTQQIIQQHDFVEIPLADANLPGVVEKGIQCPGCQHFYFAAWDSETLKAQRLELQRTRGILKRALARRYELDFKKFQADMTERARQLREAHDLAEKEAHDSTTG